MSNINLISTNHFKENGFSIIRNFLDQKIINQLNLELDQMFNQILFNGYNKGSIILDNEYSREAIPSPCINIQSINLMETTIDIFNIVIDEVKKKDYVVTNIMLFSEKNNSEPLKFHTDLRKGMYRAQIYLKGGQNKSGGFRYISKSHKLNHNISHELSRHELDKYRASIVDLTGSSGDLIIFDPFGFHGKYPCLDERRTIMFEFQPKDVDYPKTQIDLNGSLISKKVLDNINIFIHDYKKNDHTLDAYKNNYLTNFKILFKLISRSTSITLKNKFRNILKKVKNIKL